MSPEPMQIETGHPTACKYGLHHANPKSYTHTEMNSYFVNISRPTQSRNTTLRSQKFDMRQSKSVELWSKSIGKARQAAIKSQLQGFDGREKKIESDLNGMQTELEKNNTTIEKLSIRKEALQHQIEALKGGLKRLEDEKASFLPNVTDKV